MTQGGRVGLTKWTTRKGRRCLVLLVAAVWVLVLRKSQQCDKRASVEHGTSTVYLVLRSTYLVYTVTGVLWYYVE